jgi:hypothetical protein
VKPSSLRKLLKAEAERRGIKDPKTYWSRFCPWEPTPKQWEIINCEGKFILAGGGAGGAKSGAALIRTSLRAEEEPRLTWIVRRHLKDMRSTNGLFFLAKKWWMGTGVKLSERDMMFTFPTGAVVQFLAYDNAGDFEKIQGNSPHDVILEEGGQFEPEVADMFKTRTRKTLDIKRPTSVLVTANPGGRSHDYLREAFVEAKTRKKNHFYFHSTYLDNPHIDHEDYRQNFEAISDPVIRAQMELGDWSVKSSGRYARRENFRYIDAQDVPPTLWSATGYDIGLTTDGDPWEKATVTFWDDIWYVLDVDGKGMTEPQGREWIMGHMERAIEPHLHAIENQSVSLPTIQNLEMNSKVDLLPWTSAEWDRLKVYAETTQSVLKAGTRRIKFTPVPCKGDKLQRSSLLWQALWDGRIRFVRAPWNERVEDECIFFTNNRGDKDNVIDALGNAMTAMVRVIPYQRLRENISTFASGTQEHFDMLARIRKTS